MPFAPIVELQERIRRAVLTGRGAETLLLLEHHPVITLGRSAATTHVLAAAPELARRGVTVHRASRGGDVTFHGPGQLVGYPVVRLDGGVVAHMRAMAEGLCSVLARRGIHAVWRRDAPGLWVSTATGDAKLCSFGVNVHRRVAIHGFALNVTVDLAAFGMIVPCGLPDVEMTSMDRLARLGVASSAPPPGGLADLAGEVAAALSRSFRRDFVNVQPDELAGGDPETRAELEEHLPRAGA